MIELELELTYLAKALPSEIENVEPIELEDIYIPGGGVEYPVLRIRKKGHKYEITKKTPLVEGDASAHHESTITLSAEEYDALKTVSSRSVLKDRYKVAIDGHDAEVDVFKDLLAGLVLIDFEFNTTEEKDAFTPPKVCLVDVTQEEFIAGGLLAGKSYSDIEERLLNFGYKRLDLKG